MGSKREKKRKGVMLIMWFIPRMGFKAQMG